MTLARYTARDIVRIMVDHEIIPGARGWPAQLAAITDELMLVWEIAALDIPSLLLPDAHVWIWTTSSYTDETYRLVLPSWGLTPVEDGPRR